MSLENPYSDVTQYIENEAFRGRPISTVLDELRASGWSEHHIVSAVQQLNEQHDVLQQVDMDPLHRKAKKQRSVKVIIVSAFAAAIIGVIGFVVFLNRPVQYVTFQDPNFTMEIPQTWTRDDRYKPGSSTIFLYSSQGQVESGAFMTLYLNLFEDRFGQQLLTGDGGATILDDYTFDHDGTTTRYVEYERGATLDSPESTRGAYAFVTKGQLTVSATIASRAEYWSKHAEQAERILKTITPNCSIKNLDALYDEEGAIFLCQDKE